MVLKKSKFGESTGNTLRKFHGKGMILSSGLCLIVFVELSNQSDNPRDCTLFLVFPKNSGSAETPATKLPPVFMWWQQASYPIISR